MKTLKKLLVSIVSFGSETRYTYSDGSMKFTIHKDDKSGHRKYAVKYEDMCQ